MPKQKCRENRKRRLRRAKKNVQRQYRVWLIESMFGQVSVVMKGVLENMKTLVTLPLLGNVLAEWTQQLKQKEITE